jgi:hypothetical protein
MNIGRFFTISSSVNGGDVPMAKAHKVQLDEDQALLLWTATAKQAHKDAAGLETAAPPTAAERASAKRWLAEMQGVDPRNVKLMARPRRYMRQGAK